MRRAVLVWLVLMLGVFVFGGSGALGRSGSRAAPALDTRHQARWLSPLARLVGSGDGTRVPASARARARSLDTHISGVTYTSNTTWSLANSPYVLDGNVTVASGVTLTIEPGVVVKLNGQLRTITVNGTLSAVGTAASHITFTSIQDDSIGGDSGGDGPTVGAPGQWYYLGFASTGSQLQYVDIRYGGYGSSATAYGAVTVTSGSPGVTIQDSTISSSQCSGIYVSGGNATVKRTTISGNGGGVSVNQGSVTLGASVDVNSNSGDGLWFNLTSSYAGSASSVMDSDVHGNGNRGIYLQVAAGLATSLWPHGNRNNVYGNAGKQLSTLNENRGVDWRNNYWGDVFFKNSPSNCIGTNRSAAGSVVFRSNQSTGPFNGGTYYALNPFTACPYDAIDVEAVALSPFLLHSSPGLPVSQSLGGGRGEIAVNASGSMSDPVDSATGSFTHEVTDLSLSGFGVPFVFTRTYNSFDSTPGPFGRGWTDNLNASLVVRTGGDVTVRAGSGQQLDFVKQADGSFVPTAGGRATLSAVSGGYQLVRADQVKYSFDSSGKLTSLVDRNGEGLSMGYDGSGRVSTVTDAAGRQATIAYNSSSLISSVSLPDGRSVGYSYTNGQLKTVTDARGKTWTYYYDGSGLLSAEVDPLGHQVFWNTYGSDGRVTQQVDGTNKTTTFAWDPATQTATATDARGNQWKEVYSNNLLVKEIDPLGNTVKFAYDSDLNRSSVTDARGNSWSMSYDTAGNLLTRTAPAPLSYQQSWTYDSKNDVTGYTDGRGNTTSYAYDSRGNLTSITRPGGNVTQYTPDATTGLVTSITDPRGKTTTLGYDSHGNLTSITSPLGEQTTMGYDTSGRLTSEVDPRGNVTGANPADYTTSYAYDAANHETSETDPLGHTTAWAFDNAGNLAGVTDANTHTTSYAYDADNRLTTVTAPGGAQTSYAYDNIGNLTSKTDANNHTTSYAYNTANRLSSVTNPLNRTWSYTYDATGNRTQITTPSTGTITSGYDNLNRLTGVTYSDSTPAVTYSYDADSNRTQMTDGAGSQSYTYDTLNRLTSVTRGTDVFAYTYNADGEITQRSYPDSTSVSYTYDDDGRLATVSDGTNTTSYGYDPAGELLSAALPNGYTQAETYDRAGRITEVASTNSGGTLNQFDYSYDPVGNPTQVTTPSDVTTYTYDARDRLTKVCYQTSCPGGTDPFISWTYDNVGNRLSEQRPSGTTSYTYDAGDELTQAGSTSYSYDLNGNETAAGSRSFTANLANETTSTTSSGNTTSYTYDGDGNRLQVATASQTTNELWDANNPLPQLALERDGSGTTIRDYLRGDGPLAIATGGSDYYFHTDALGSITNLTNATGNTEWTYSYEPYGAARSTTQNDPNAPANPIRFNAQLLDDSGLYNLRARNYDPSTGRFTTTDPLPSTRTTTAMSSYAYANDQPTTLTDPSGMGAVLSDLQTSATTQQPRSAPTPGPFYPFVPRMHGSCWPEPSDYHGYIAGLEPAWAWGWHAMCEALDTLRTGTIAATRGLNQAAGPLAEGAMGCAEGAVMSGTTSLLGGGVSGWRMATGCAFGAAESIASDTGHPDAAETLAELDALGNLWDLRAAAMNEESNLNRLLMRVFFS